MRNFAQACAIIVGGIGSWLLFDFQITMPFVSGVSLVIASIFLYGSKAEQVAAWLDVVKAKLGIRGSAEEARKPAQMEPLIEESASSLHEDDEEDARLEPPSMPAPTPPSDRNA